MEKKDSEKQIIDLGKVFRTMWGEKKLFCKVWVCTFILACIWILPQPRFYTSEVKLAPEVGSEDGGGLSSIASSFGLNIGGGGQDAIYPELYPELFRNPKFVVGLFDIQVTTKEGDLTTNYFTYMKSHQKPNLLTLPYNKARRAISNFLEEEDKLPRGNGAADINPFQMNKKDYLLMQQIMDNIMCVVDKKTDVITITVKDQDPLIAATMADSVKVHLQDFIIRYRTSKVSEDLAHYQQMRDEAAREYDKVMAAYSRYCDSHQNVIMQSFQSERDKLEDELALKQNTLTAMETQLQATRVKLQEKTPAFTTLVNAIVPVRPAGPKRMLFVIGMLMLATMVTAGYLLYKDNTNSHK